MVVVVLNGHWVEIVELTTGGQLDDSFTSYDPDTNGTATFTLPTLTVADNGAERTMYRKGDFTNFLTITGNICDVNSQRVLGLINEFVSFKWDGFTWREDAHSLQAFATLSQEASSTFSITTSFTKLTTWDTTVFSTNGKLIADLANNEIDILDFEGPIQDGYDIRITLTFEYTNNTMVTGQIAVDGTPVSTPVSVNGLGTNKLVSLIIDQQIGVGGADSISLVLKADSGGTLTAITGRFTASRIKG